MILASGPNSRGEYGQQLFESIQRKSAPRTVRITSPYVTQAGLGHFTTNQADESWLGDCDSEWVIGLCQGITDPDALSELLEHDNTRAKLFLPRGRITPQSLNQSPYLHAKTCLMSSENDPSDSSLLVTSANITNAAVGNYPTNYEIGVLEESISQNYRDEYLGWWSNIEAQSISLSNDLIEQYSGIRDTIASSTSPDVDLGSSRSSDSAADAKYLWIFSGTLSSDSRHQLDLKRELAAFFSNQESDYDIDIEIDGRNYQGNEVVYRPHHQTDQWRIHLPTTSDGFEPHGHDTYVFCDMHLMFEKVPNDGNEYYKLTISDDATQVEEWRVNAEELGDHGFTEPIGNQGEEREYGYY